LAITAGSAITGGGESSGNVGKSDTSGAV